MKLPDPSDISASIYCYKSLENTSKVEPAIRPLLAKAKAKEKDVYVFTGADKKKKTDISPKFFDLWEEDNKPKSEMDDLLPKKSVKVPPNLFQKPLLLPSVCPPEPGQSYNPEKKAYSKLVRRVIRKENKVSKKAAKIDRQAASVRRPEAELDRDYMTEMSQGLDLHPASEKNVDAVVEAVEGHDDPAVATPVKEKKETKKKKKKKKKVLTRAVVKKEQPKSMKKILKEIKEEEALAEVKRKKRDAKIVKQLHKPKKVRGIREEDKIALPLPNEITGSLRSTRVIGDLLRERFTSFQERSLVDYPKRELKNSHRARVKPWTKYSVKRSYRDDK